MRATTRTGISCPRRVWRDLSVLAVLVGELRRVHAVLMLTVTDSRTAAPASTPCSRGRQPILSEADLASTTVSGG